MLRRVFPQLSPGGGWWLLLALGVSVLLAGADLALGPAVVLLGIQTVPPVVASLRLGPRTTALVAAWSLVVAIVLGSANGIFATTDHATRLVAVVAVGLLAVWIAALREGAKRASQAARERDHEARLVLEAVEDYAIFMVDPDGRVASWNAGAQRIKGYTAEEIIGEHFSCFYLPEDVAAGKPARMLEMARSEGRCEEEGWRVGKDGERFMAHVVFTRICDEAKKLRGFSKVTRDITERRALEEKLSHQAKHDGLTGVANRVLFLERVHQALARSERRGDVVAVLFIDLDRFKRVNDSLGHAAGDELLVAVAGRIREAVRLEDTIGRLGGDEFTVLCEDLHDEREGIVVAERINDALEAPFGIADSEVFAGASVGIAFGGAEGVSSDALVRDADTAMYEAKQSGRGRYVVFKEGMRPQALERLATEGALRRAIGEDGFRVVYQPVFSLETNTIVGLEALVRWEHPRRGWLEPRDFIPLAEEIGLILSIDAFVLETACRQVAAWRAEFPDHPPLRVLVNLSAASLAEPALPKLVQETLASTGADPASLCLEMTETMLMSDAPATMSSLLALKGLGVRLAVDDFGTGYSSLNYLRRFPVDYLKVDRSFVEGLGTGSDDSALVAAMTSLAHALGLTVIAEGVENSDQLTELRALGCELAQGFYLDRPQPAEALADVLAAGRRLHEPVVRDRQTAH